MFIHICQYSSFAMFCPSVQISPHLRRGIHCVLWTQRPEPGSNLALSGNFMVYATEHMGVSENSVPLNPMVLLIIIPFLNGYFIGNIPYFQTNPYQTMKQTAWFQYVSMVA